MYNLLLSHLAGNGNVTVHVALCERSHVTALKPNIVTKKCLRGNHGLFLIPNLKSELYIKSMR